MTKEEAKKEICNVFEPAFANYIITALEEGATVSDWCEDAVSREDLIDKLEIVDKRYGSDFYWEMRKIVDRLQPVTPVQKTGKWIKRGTEEKIDCLGDKVEVAWYECSKCGRIITDIGTVPLTRRIEDYPYCHCGSRNEVEEE